MVKQHLRGWAYEFMIINYNYYTIIRPVSVKLIQDYSWQGSGGPALIWWRAPSASPRPHTEALVLSEEQRSRVWSSVLTTESSSHHYTIWQDYSHYHWPLMTSATENTDISGRLKTLWFMIEHMAHHLLINTQHYLVYDSVYID